MTPLTLCPFLEQKNRYLAYNFCGRIDNLNVTYSSVRNACQPAGVHSGYSESIDCENSRPAHCSRPRHSRLSDSSVHISCRWRWDASTGIRPNLSLWSQKLKKDYSRPTGPERRPCCSSVATHAQFLTSEYRNMCLLIFFQNSVGFLFCLFVFVCVWTVVKR